MRTSFVLGLAALAVVPALSACKDAPVSTSPALPQGAVARVEAGSARVVASRAALLSAASEKFFAIHPEEKGGVVFDEVSFDYAEGEQAYLVARGKTAEGNCRRIAMPVVESDGHLFMASQAEALSKTMLAEETHTCKGEPCSSCAFVKSGGQTTGCRCDQVGDGPYQCNHTVSG